MHHPHEFVILIGDSSKARKGSSFDHVAKLMTEADPASRPACPPVSRAGRG